MYLKSVKGKWNTVVLLAVMLVIALLFASLAGCGSSGTSGGSGKITLTDDAGNKLVLDKPADRIVSLAPGNTEIVYAVGAQDKLVGVTTYCDYPPAAKKKPKIGDFSTPNVEKIASVNPQVVLVTGGIQKGMVESLNKLGIKVFVIDPKSFEALFKDMEAVGVMAGIKDVAARKVEAMRKQVSEIQAKAKDLPKTNVFFEIYKQPLMTAGTGTMIDLMINTAGGKNLGAAAGPQFPEFSEEQLLKDNPDVYVAVKGSQSDPADISQRPGYSALKAVKDGRVYVVEDNPFVRSGPRLVQGLQQLAQILHPEVFKKNS
jgi:iron complex transport system substrate-binding protein